MEAAGDGGGHRPQAVRRIASGRPPAGQRQRLVLLPRPAFDGHPTELQELRQQGPRRVVFHVHAGLLRLAHRGASRSGEALGPHRVEPAVQLQQVRPSRYRLDTGHGPDVPGRTTARVGLDERAQHPALPAQVLENGGRLRRTQRAVGQDTARAPAGGQGALPGQHCPGVGLPQEWEEQQAALASLVEPADVLVPAHRAHSVHPLGGMEEESVRIPAQEITPFPAGSRGRHTERCVATEVAYRGGTHEPTSPRHGCTRPACPRALVHAPHAGAASVRAPLPTRGTWMRVAHRLPCRRTPAGCVSPRVGTLHPERPVFVACCLMSSA